MPKIFAFIVLKKYLNQPLCFLLRKRAKQKFNKPNINPTQRLNPKADSQIIPIVIPNKNPIIGSKNNCPVIP